MEQKTEISQEDRNNIAKEIVGINNFSLKYDDIGNKEGGTWWLFANFKGKCYYALSSKNPFEYDGILKGMR